MSEYLSPGLFLKERSSSAGPIAGVSTSTYATIGWLRKGPENQPQLVTSFKDFVDKFGTYWRNSYVPFAIARFFQNEGARAYVSRVVPTDAVKASATCFSDSATAAEFIGRSLPATTDLSTNKNIAIAIDGDAAVDIDASAGAVDPAAVTPAEMVTAIDGTVGITCTLETGDRLKIVSDTTGATSGLVFQEASANDNTTAIVGLDVSGSTTYTYSGEAASSWSGEAAWKGAYYNQLRQCWSGNNDYQDGNGGFTRYDVLIEEESAVGEADWDVKETYEAVVLDDDTDDNFVSTVVNDDTELFKITEGATYDAPRELRPTYHLAEWIGEGDAADVTFTGTLLGGGVHEGSLSIVADAITATDDGDGNLTGTGVDSGTINYDTGQVSITFSVAPASGVQILATYYQPPAETSVCCQLASGSDGTTALTRAQVTDPTLEASKTGIYAFDQFDEMLTISLPDFAGNVTVSNDLISYSENKKNRFAILTTVIGTTPADAIKFVRNTAQYDSKYAAFYYPWVKIYDPIANDGRTVTIPPDGFVAGVYARTDRNRNVGKAPGGVSDGRLVGAVGLERTLDKGERDTLYPARINALIESPQTGRAVWGVRTLSKNAEWRYVNVTRLFQFVEQSIYNAMFWTVFENNGPGLWAKVKAQSDAFLTNLYRDGYFAGNTPNEAFLVVVDETNNPQSAIDSGLLTVDYYLAANKPSEFIQLRFQQKVNS